MLALAKVGGSLLLLAKVEAVGHGEVETRPGEEEPGPEGDGADDCAAGDLNASQGRLHGRFGEKAGPGERFRGDWRDDDKGDQPLARRRQAGTPQQQVDK